MALDHDIKIWSKKREKVVARLQKLFELSRKLDGSQTENKDVKSFKLLFPNLDKLIEEIDELDIKLNRLNLEGSGDYEPTFTNYHDMVDQIEETAKILDIDDSETSSEGQTSSRVERDSESIIDSKVLLRKLDIPEFSGAQENWQVFSQMFQAFVDSNKTLTDLHKVSFLISKLKGAALKLCQQIPPTGANYQIIKDLIWSRFDDSRIVVDDYLDKIFKFDPLKIESRENLEKFLDTFHSSIAALRRLKLDSLEDRVFLYRALHVLDPRTRREFEMSVRGQADQTYGDLIKFVESQLRVLRSSDLSADKLSHKPLDKYDQREKRNTTSHSLVINSPNIEAALKCSHCRISGHQIGSCRKFLKLSPWERFNSVKRMKLCLRCFSSSHPASSCDRNIKCKDCNLPHHSLLHFPFKTKSGPESKVVESAVSGNSSASNLCAMANATSHKVASTVLLSTAQVKVTDGHGKEQLIRVLLDSGSQSHFLTAKACKRLALPVHKIKFSVLGIGGLSSPVLGKTDLSFSSKFDSNCRYTIESLVVNKIVEKLPSAKVDLSKINYLHQLKLADENFSTPNEIDGVIGAELVPHLITGEWIGNKLHQPAAMYSPLGFIILGKAPVAESGPPVSAVTLCNLASEVSLPKFLEKFWEIEEVPNVTSLTEDEISCEQFYKSTVSRTSQGRYVVALPFKVNPPPLGESYQVAERRFFNLERKLDRNPEMKIAYHKVLQDYIDQGHLSLAHNPDRRTGYFIPHHCIYKESTSTPMRVVFDASAKTSVGLSLNDSLFVGQKLQSDLFSLLVNFRLFKIGLCADIKQMYRQILVRESDRIWQQIVWRFSKDSPVQIYRHNTVVFGLSSSPFLALRTVQQLVEDVGEGFPIARHFVPRDMYMDDLVTSVESTKEASDLHVQSKALFTLGGLKLVKWSSNVPDQIPHFSDRVEGVKEFDCDNSLPVLGLVWNPKLDNFHFRLDMEKREGTKRNILSTIARIYDPIGFLAPVILSVKCILKELWADKADWDQAPSASLAKKWDRFQEQLEVLTELQIPRCLGVQGSVEVSLMGFCDASEMGYGAVIYLLVVSESCERSLHFLCAKSKIAPTKTQSIPRLELLAAFLLAKLIKCAYDAIQIRKSVKEVLAFSDSEIVLCWLKASPANWQTFVANRVAKIQERTEINQWLHISGNQNPADCLSRGLLPRDLAKNRLWWKGPYWGELEPEKWPVNSTIPDCELPERKSSSTTLTTVTIESSDRILELIDRCSNYNTLLKITVVILRFLKLVPKDPNIRHDLTKAEMFLCRSVQRVFFKKDISNLLQNRPVSKRLRYLNPFLADGLIRVGGRLNQANIGFDYAHPILLPKTHSLVTLLIDSYHQCNLHTGPHLLLSILRQRFWILSARSVVRQRVRACNVCFRVKPRPNFPFMADLPAYRINESKAFLHTGVDYAGPIKISIGRKRNPVTSKAYICLFICLTTKAVHLELVSGLSTELFLGAFKRFLSRRGDCRVMYSDNGTNFLGAKAELEVYSFFSNPTNKNVLINGLIEYRVDWKFLPPNAPHFGGIWESNIKSVKTHLSKIVGSQILTYEEFSSVLVQIEALLNSRPLCPLSADPADPIALTPAHFLMSVPVKALPAENLLDLSPNRLSRFQLVDQIVQSFWSRWRKEYLHELQVRRKWLTEASSIVIGTVVVVEQTNLPPLSWPLGIVDEVYPGRDGTIRVVKVRTATGSYKRPVVKLFPLPTQ